jgi:electron transfer flavoprotein beta subunit
MKVIACYKWVLDEADLRIDPKSRGLITERAKSKISEYDRTALECGVQLAEAQGGDVIALTAGTAEAKKSLKDVLSRGPAEVFYVNDEAMAKTDPSVTAKVLAAAVRQIGEYDLIACGEGSSDGYSQQVGIRLAQNLGVPVITFVNKLEVDGRVFLAERKLDEGIEVVEVDLPAVVTVLPDLNVPRIPSLKQILAAAKKPVREVTLKDLGLEGAQITPKLVRREVLGTVMERKRIRVEGEAENIATQTLEILKNEGVL